MRDIIYSATPYQVTSSLADILHGSGYAKFSPMPLNFHVRLFKDEKGVRNHNGCGALTLTTEGVGHQFSSEYGDRVKTNQVFIEQKQSTTRCPGGHQTSSVHGSSGCERKREERCRISFGDRSYPSGSIWMGMQRFHIFHRMGANIPQVMFLLFDDDRRELRIKIPQANAPNTAIIAMTSQPIH